MRSIDLLRQEHDWIARLLHGFQQHLEAGARAGRLESGATLELLSLLGHFADGLHQRREEQALFPRLLARATSVEQRLFLGRLAAEHEQDREHFAVMQRSLLGATYGHSMDLREFLRAAGRYLDLQRQHMVRENGQLLPLAESLLTEEDDAVLVQTFRAMDAGDPGSDDLPSRVEAALRATSF